MLELVVCKYNICNCSFAQIKEPKPSLNQPCILVIAFCMLARKARLLCSYSLATPLSPELANQGQYEFYQDQAEEGNDDGGS